MLTRTGQQPGPADKGAWLQNRLTGPDAEAEDAGRGRPQAGPPTAPQGPRKCSRNQPGAIRNEDVAYAPHGLDVARVGASLFEHLAQARHLQRPGCGQRPRTRDPRASWPVVARQRVARMAHQCLQHRNSPVVRGMSRRRVPACARAQVQGRSQAELDHRHRLAAGAPGTSLAGRRRSAALMPGPTVRAG